MKKMWANFSNRLAYTLSAIGIFIILAVGVYAVTGVSHSSSEIVVDTALCTQITGHGCGTDLNTDTNTNSQTICANNLFLDGDGQCRSASQIVSDGGGSSTTYYMNLGEDYYEYWNTDGGCGAGIDPHGDSCPGNDNTNPYVCPADSTVSCLDSAATGKAQHHRGVICRTATITSNPGSYTMSKTAELAWEFYTGHRLNVLCNTGACSLTDSCTIVALDKWGVTSTGAVRTRTASNAVYNQRG